MIHCRASLRSFSTGQCRTSGRRTLVSGQTHPEQIARLIAETFENSGESLSRFSDAQLGQGFSFLLDAGGSEFMFSLVEAHVPVAVRLRALRSFVALFEQVMAVRCSL